MAEVAGAGLSSGDAPSDLSVPNDTADGVFLGFCSFPAFLASSFSISARIDLGDDFVVVSDSVFHRYGVCEVVVADDRGLLWRINLRGT